MKKNASIQMTDLKSQYERIKGEIDSAIGQVIDKSGFILGSQVAALEGEIAGYLGAGFGVGVASGTDALVLALSACGIGKGDEVITTPFTFIATAEAISRVGAKPVFCDIDRDTFNIDPQKLKDKITSRTKALLPVHLYGMPCEMDEIMDIASGAKLKVIEDCAQSFGAQYKGRKAGVFGECGCLSFFPAKTLGCYGDGGMVVTSDKGIAEKIKVLRNHGSQEKYYYSMHGFNSRLDTLQAAVLLVKMKYIERWIEQRIENAMYYAKLLSGVSGLVLPVLKGYSRHGFNYYTIRVKGRRDAVQKRLKEKNIPSAIYYPHCLHLQEVYRDLGYKQGDLPAAEEAQEEVLSLPMCPELSKENIEYITQAVKEAL